jgi:hypothetical protein
MTKKQDYSVGIIGPDEDVKEEPKMSTEEFLEILNRDEMIDFFTIVNKSDSQKSLRAARKIIKRFINEDTKLSILRAFFIVCLFNLTDYKFIREMYQSAVNMAPICQVKLTDVYHASMVLEGNSEFDKNIEGLAPFIKDIVNKLVIDVRNVRSNKI